MNKYRIKKADTWFESKTKPDPIKLYFFTILFLLLGVLGARFNQHQIEESRLKNPATINVKFVEASCEERYRRGRPTGDYRMSKMYVYSLTQSGNREHAYKTYDSIWYASKSDCEADLEKASTISPRTQVWYDQDEPWESRWSLDEPSPVRVFWYFSILAGVLFLFGLLEHRKMKQHRKNDLLNG